jgi:hypothetical protein
VDWGLLREAAEARMDNGEAKLDEENSHVKFFLLPFSADG